MAEDVADAGPATKRHRTEAADVASGAQDVRVPLAVALGYVGTAFCGLQVQPTLPLECTVEGRLFTALFAAGAITADPRTMPALKLLQHLFYNRGNRTDKYVHAACNVVTLQLRSSAISDPNLIERINQQLAIPATFYDQKGSEVTIPGNSIRLFCFVRVQRGFTPRTFATRRVYRYLIPAFALDPKLDDFSPPDDEDLARCRELAATANAVFAKVCGRHRFHNFTEDPQLSDSLRYTKVKAWDCEAIRHVLGAVVASIPLLLPDGAPRDAQTVPSAECTEVQRYPY
jgi:tRNA pseudouridine(38-40) synthase